MCHTSNVRLTPDSGQHSTELIRLEITLVTRPPLYGLSPLRNRLPSASGLRGFGHSVESPVALPTPVPKCVARVLSTPAARVSRRSSPI